MNTEGINLRFFDLCHLGVYACQRNKLFCKHLGVVISRVCEDFLCQARGSAAMLLIVQCWLKWVKKETWSDSGRCLVCK